MSKIELQMGNFGFQIRDFRLGRAFKLKLWFLDSGIPNRASRDFRFASVWNPEFAFELGYLNAQVRLCFFWVLLISVMTFCRDNKYRNQVVVDLINNAVFLVNLPGPVFGHVVL